MFTPRLPCSTVVLALVVALPAAYAEGPNLGKPVIPADIAAWDTSIMPDGTGLPAGSGTSVQGAIMYAQPSAWRATVKMAKVEQAQR
jgi:cytochrome c